LAREYRPAKTYSARHLFYYLIAPAQNSISNFHVIYS